MSDRKLARLLAALILVVIGGSASGRDTSCHIHPPGSTPEEPINIVGPFANPAACQKARRQRFGATGRCHCRADFTPGWMPREERPTIPREPADLL